MCMTFILVIIIIIKNNVIILINCNDSNRRCRYSPTSWTKAPVSCPSSLYSSSSWEGQLGFWPPSRRQGTRSLWSCTSFPPAPTASFSLRCTTTGDRPFLWHLHLQGPRRWLLWPWTVRLRSKSSTDALDDSDERRRPGFRVGSPHDIRDVDAHELFK